MENGVGSVPEAASGHIDKSRVLEVRPLRCLVPVFPNSPGMSSITNPHPTPFVCVPPSGPFPTGVQPFYPFLVQNESVHAPGPHNQPGFGFASGIPSPVPLNSFRTPTPRANGSTSQPKRASKARRSVLDEDGHSESQNQSDQYMSGFGVGSDGVDVGNSSGKRKNRPKKTNDADQDIDPIISGFFTDFKLKEFDESRRSSSDKETVTTILVVFDLIRRRLTQLEEAKDITPGITKRSDLKAGNLLMSKGIRTNNMKRIGHIPGIDVGDIFFYRMELCIVGLHAQSMGGIDYMGVKITADEDPLAVSLVSAGGYDDDGNDSNTIIYSGQGGVQRRDGQMFDQKLERGNLALEKSLHRGNDVRVIRGIKDSTGTTGKIYIYDGLYKIQESWTEKNKSQCNVFKYKLVRVHGQPESFSVWKSIQQWKDGTAGRPGLILPDLTSGAEKQPVALVNDVDGDKGPAHFTYIPSLKYSQPFTSAKASVGCHCVGGCQPTDKTCSCNLKNDGYVPYSTYAVLLANKPLIHECGSLCPCPPNCRNRMSQSGIKIRLEVFKTENRGWGLRSWDPIRTGGFICEFAGDVIKTDAAGNFVNGNNDSYIFDSTRYYSPLEPAHDPSSSKKSPFPLVVSAKNNGNVARFMNHSCSPNVFWLPVLRESNNNEVYLHILFFATRHIPPLQELTYDYGIVQGDKGNTGKKKCLCGSPKCRGFFY